MYYCRQATKRNSCLPNLNDLHLAAEQRVFTMLCLELLKSETSKSVNLLIARICYRDNRSIVFSFSGKDLRYLLFRLVSSFISFFLINDLFLLY